MFTRVILAAGVAAMAISAPASAQRDRGDRDRPKAERTERAQQRAQRAQRVERAPRVERAQRAQRVERANRVQRDERANRVERSNRIERAERANRIERANRVQRVERAERIDRQQRLAQRAERQQRVERANRIERPNRIQRAERANRQELRAQRVDRQQLRAQRVDRSDVRVANRQQLRDERRLQRMENRAATRELRALARNDVIRVRDFDDGAVRIRTVDRDDIIARRLGRRFVSPAQAVTFIGEPVSVVTRTVALSPVPLALQPLYMDDDDFYWRYGGGYMYRIDRDDDLIAALIPLAFGGLLPGSYLPNTYMNSYVPAYYGFNSFYPDTPYDCHRYVNGIIYEVDCVTGMVEDVIPLYAGGYGVGQMLPVSYGYYNVPLQYRSMYYNTPDYNYWYAPGAIYQVDPTTSLITAIASLLTPGFTVGQPLPMGYSMYNVPLAYRSTYYDTPNAWYRYNNGYIYQVDPTTMLVTAIVASILT